MELRKFYEAIWIPLILIIILWAFHIIYVSTGSRLGLIGVYPRSFEGIIGIFAAPFLHGDWKHLLSNTVPLFVLTTIIYSFYKSIASKSIFLVYILTGVAVWLFGREVIHIGASGVVYGLVAFVFWNGIFRRNLKSIILALIVTILYSGYFLGILPNQEGISWESHLFGGIIGIFVSYIMRDTVEQDEIAKNPWANEDSHEERYFLQRDVFERTKAERLNPQQKDWTQDHTM